MTFFMAMAPVVELRGAIPLGVAAGLPPAVAAVTAMLGNMVPVPFILLLLRKVFALLRRVCWLGPKIDKLEKRAHLKGRKVKKYRTLGLVLLANAPPGADTGGGLRLGLDALWRAAPHVAAMGVPSVALGGVPGAGKPHHRGGRTADAVGARGAVGRRAGGDDGSRHLRLDARTGFKRGAQ